MHHYENLTYQIQIKEFTTHTPAHNLFPKPSPTSANKHDYKQCEVTSLNSALLRTRLLLHSQDFYSGQFGSEPRPRPPFLRTLHLSPELRLNNSVYLYPHITEAVSYNLPHTHTEHVKQIGTVLPLWLVIRPTSVRIFRLLRILSTQCAQTKCRHTGQMVSDHLFASFLVFCLNLSNDSYSTEPITWHR